MLKGFRAEPGEIRLDSLVLDSEFTKEFRSGHESSKSSQWQIVQRIQELATGKLEINIGRVFLGAELIVSNPSTDTLWIQHLDAILELDSVLKSPLTLSHGPVSLAPGSSRVWVDLSFAMDSRLLQIRSLDSLRIHGLVLARQSQFSRPVEIPVDHKRKIPPEISRKALSKAKETAIANLVDAWVKSMMR